MVLSQEDLVNIQQQLQGLKPEEQQEKMQELLTQMSPEDLAEMQKQQCPFCLISEGKIDAKAVYEDGIVKAVLDINPANKGHVILFPKEHATFLFQLKDETVAHLFKTANKLSKIIFEVMKAQGTNILVANGAVAGQNTPHTVVHIIPRFEKDELNFLWKPKKVDEKEHQAIAAKLAAAAKGLAKKEEAPVVTVQKAEDEEEERIP